MPPKSPLAARKIGRAVLVTFSYGWTRPSSGWFAVIRSVNLLSVCLSLAFIHHKTVNILKPSTVVLLHFCHVCFCFLGQVLFLFCHSSFAMCITSEKNNCFPSLHCSCTQNSAESDTSVLSASILPVTDRLCPISPKRHSSRKLTPFLLCTGMN